MVAHGISPIQIKVCGITRREDVETCGSLGIDWIGFNFWPKSKRYISPEAAQPLVAAAQGMHTVGVFVNPTIAEVTAAIADSGINFIQLHGRESWETIQAMPLPVIKALSSEDLEDFQGLPLVASGLGASHQPSPEPQLGPVLGPLRYLLIDSPAGAAFGGTGKAFSWSLLRHRNLPMPYFLAGGLGPENIAEAATYFQDGTNPFAFDLNSKVESTPGIKDAQKLRSALAALSALRG